MPCFPVRYALMVGYALHPSNAGLNRRSLLCRVAGWTGLPVFTGPRAFGASDFWNRKEPPEWSEDEIDRLRNKSPWSKRVRSETAGGPAVSMDSQGSRGSFGGMSGADNNGISIGGGGTRGGQASTGLGGP